MIKVLTFFTCIKQVIIVEWQLQLTVDLYRATNMWFQFQAPKLKKVSYENFENLCQCDAAVPAKQKLQVRCRFTIEFIIIIAWLM